MNVVHHAEALDVLLKVPDASVDLVYVDPPFGTGKRQESHGMAYDDSKDGYTVWLSHHVDHLRRVLKPNGTMYLHIDWRHVHVARMECDRIFGVNCFLNEVIWAYDYGGRGKDRWPRKHDNILVYARNAGQHVFNWDDIDKIPYMAPGLQKDPERAEAGKVPTDVWWMSIVGTSSKERTGYPTQKPLKLVERAVLASSPPGGVVLDCFAGSGTTGEAAYKHGRGFILADTSPWAIEVMQGRFKGIDVTWKL